MRFRTIKEVPVGTRFNKWTFLGIVNRNGENYMHMRCDCGTERDYFKFRRLSKDVYSCIHCSPRKGAPKRFNLKRGRRYGGWKIIQPHPTIGSYYKVECKQEHVLKAVPVTDLVSDEKLLCKKCIPRPMRIRNKGWRLE